VRRDGWRGPGGRRTRLGGEMRAGRMALVLLLCGVWLWAAGCGTGRAVWRTSEGRELRDGLVEFVGLLLEKEDALRGRGAAVLAMQEAIIAGRPRYSEEYRVYYWRGKGWSLEFTVAGDGSRSSQAGRSPRLGGIEAFCMYFAAEGRRGALTFYLYPERKQIRYAGSTVVEALQRSGGGRLKIPQVKEAVVQVMAREMGFWRSPVEVQELAKVVREESGLKAGEEMSEFDKRARRLRGGMDPGEDEPPSSFTWRAGRFEVSVSCSYYSDIRRMGGRLMRRPGGYGVNEIVMSVYGKGDALARRLEIFPLRRILTAYGPTRLSALCRAGEGAGRKRVKRGSG